MTPRKQFAYSVQLFGLCALVVLGTWGMLRAFGLFLRAMGWLQ